MFPFFFLIENKNNKSSLTDNNHQLAFRVIVRNVHVLY